jgi:hypothetical protein
VKRVFLNIMVNRLAIVLAAVGYFNAAPAAEGGLALVSGGKTVHAIAGEHRGLYGACVQGDYFAPVSASTGALVIGRVPPDENVAFPRGELESVSNPGPDAGGHGGTPERG